MTETLRFILLLDEPDDDGNFLKASKPLELELNLRSIPVHVSTTIGGKNQSRYFPIIRSLYLLRSIPRSCQLMSTAGFLIMLTDRFLQTPISSFGLSYHNLYRSGRDRLSTPYDFVSPGGWPNCSDIASFGSTASSSPLTTVISSKSRTSPGSSLNGVVPVT